MDSSLKEVNKKMEQGTSDQQPQPAPSSPADWFRRPAVRALLAIGLAVGGGLGTFAVANAASASPAATASPSTSPGSSGSNSTHNCPNM